MIFALKILAALNFLFELCVINLQSLDVIWMECEVKLRRAHGKNRDIKLVGNWSFRGTGDWSVCAETLINKWVVTPYLYKQESRLREWQLVAGGGQRNKIKMVLIHYSIWTKPRIHQSHHLTRFMHSSISLSLSRKPESAKYNQSIHIVFFPSERLWSQCPLNIFYYVW